MIFTKEHCQMIAAGIKTQTCRVAKDDETLDWVFEPNTNGIDTVFNNPDLERIKWQVGKDYAVQPGRGKAGLWIHKYENDIYEWDEGENVYKSWCERYEQAQEIIPLRIRITAIDLMPVQMLTLEDLQREGGYKSLRAFAEAWDSINTNPLNSYMANPDVWRLQFEVVR